jgi:DNA repair photolyase
MPYSDVVLQYTSSYALHPQEKLGQYDFPFTLNPTIGCFFGCRYCYSPLAVYGYNSDRKKRFFETAYVKLDKPAHLAKELPKFAVLPSHLKRVQINETSDYYLPQVFNKLSQGNEPDLMLGIYEEFEKAWNTNNKWMLHILTKSHLILKHIGKLKDMRHMVQVEISFATHDDNILRSIEYFTPSIKRRLETVEEMSKAGIFVRIMAMPFYGNSEDLLMLKNEAFNRGAKAFKNKGLNYFSWDDLKKSMTFDEFIEEKIPRTGGRTDTKDESLIIKSGEYIMENGAPKNKLVLMPKMDAEYHAVSKWAALTKMKERFEERNMQMIDSGYRDCNSENWGYVI